MYLLSYNLLSLKAQKACQSGITSSKSVIPVIYLHIYVYEIRLFSLLIIKEKYIFSPNNTMHHLVLVWFSSLFLPLLQTHQPTLTSKHLKVIDCSHHPCFTHCYVTSLQSSFPVHEPSWNPVTITLKKALVFQSFFISITIHYQVLVEQGFRVLWLSALAFP